MSIRPAVSPRAHAAPSHASDPDGEGPTGRPDLDDVIDLSAYSLQQPPKMEHMRSYLGYLVRRLDNKIYASFLSELGEDEITPSRYTALAIIAHNPGVRQVDIARVLEVARPAALKVVNHLIGLGLVEAHPMPHDKRVGALALTAKGRSKFSAYEDAVRRHEQRVFQALSPDDLDTLAGLLARAVDS